ncbi:peptide-binding protein [Rhodococcus sp. BP-252]|uniref:ABC transporter substrate-binding protein n=1 Tax=unclassified Rhodococcus (in: high G+C Gram-positive bacteria) TaxID=192944 RepID=UPI001430F94E|nr:MULTISPECIES: ABC transporter substrate-binding protein [unclassified Rhodococcus (in: high G+C Gram-positive bacteria)]MBY6414474.1 peptide-binding protein [Rhodococcus sp. BP-320]MBY6419216.1 peptide-binding protein [Rhodococcus sp. BP-321]MBY6423941.1 peptide-binding protein [Rhodococcus sp. BP-324]MBY6429323.1 peptide-binding protein [Rhodococcus sp. BP-323]MBY6434284.1 peptide-binding protein [Rhodococcus sp. BP-322]
MHARIGVVRTTTAAVAAVVTASVVAGCSAAEDQVPSIGYALDNVVSTYNANTVDGAASGARQAFPRVQTGFSYLGPEGEALADNDIGSAAVVPGDVLTVRYVIAPQAVYSDGVPMTCDDLVLTWAANSGRFVAGENDLPLFDAASTAGYKDIDQVACSAGAKEATVTFRAGRSYSDWRNLFGATDILPAHVAARVAGVPDVVAPIASDDLDVVGRIAEFWNTGWNLTPGSVDTSLLPSNGPYRVDSYTADGGLVLVANDKWWGIAPSTDRIVVWPKGTDIQSRAGDGELEVIDHGAGNDVPADGFARTDYPSTGIEQLTFATSGALAPSAARRAIALCTPRQSLFDSYGHPGFDETTGVGSGVVDSRLVRVDDLLYAPVAATAANRFRQPDIATATAELAGAGIDGLTVRIGYLAPDSRRAQIVADIAAACAPAGITVQDAGSPQFSPTALRTGEVDAILGSTASASGAAGSVSDATAHDSLHSGAGSNVGGYANGRIDAIVDQLSVETSDASRLALSTEGENILWNDMPSLPLFSAPRTAAVADGMGNVVVDPTAAGIGWNMDRWILLR